MAVLARRRVVVARLQRQAVDAGVVALRLPRMALRTSHLPRRLVVIGMLGRETGVATDASIGSVRRQFQFGRVHEQGNRLAGGVGLKERVVAVAVKTVAVFKPGQRGRCRQHKSQCHQPSKFIHIFNFGQLMANDSPCFVN